MKKIKDYLFDSKHMTWKELIWFYSIACILLGLIAWLVTWCS